MPSAGDTVATGWPSTTTCRASRARRRPWSSATSPAARATIRVGSGGIMLPNHAPLVIAEQFGTLEALYPGRIDLGLGRAPGTDQLTARALRRDLAGHRRLRSRTTSSSSSSYFRESAPGQRGAGGPRRGARCADLDSRVESLRRASCRGAGPPLRLRLALRARRISSRRSTLPTALQALRDARRSPTPMLGGERVRRRHRRRRAAPLHLRASRHSRNCRGAPRSSCRRRSMTCESFGRRRRRRRPRACCAMAFRLCRHSTRRLRGCIAETRRGRGHGGVGDLRSCGAAALL